MSPRKRHKPRSMANPRPHTASAVGVERTSVQFQRQRGRAAGRLDNPSPEELRECIQQQLCWWCGVDGWKVLATHTRFAHGISAFEVRSLAGLFGKVSICSPEASSAARNRAINRDAIDNVHRRGNKGHQKHHFTLAGMASQLTRNKEWRTNNPEKFRDQIKAATAAMVAKISMPHKCLNPGCEVQIPRRKPYTCSPRCRSALQAKRGRARFNKGVPVHRQVPKSTEEVNAVLGLKGDSDVAVD